MPAEFHVLQWCAQWHSVHCEVWIYICTVATYTIVSVVNNKNACVCMYTETVPAQLILGATFLYTMYNITISGLHGVHHLRATPHKRPHLCIRSPAEPGLPTMQVFPLLLIIGIVCFINFYTQLSLSCGTGAI